MAAITATPSNIQSVRVNNGGTSARPHQVVLPGHSTSPHSATLSGSPTITQQVLSKIQCIFSNCWGSQQKPSILRRALSGLWGSGRWTLIITIFALVLAYVMMKIALWTARKDFVEHCQNFQNANRTLTLSCTKALENPLPPPPLYGSPFMRREVETRLQSWTEPEFADEDEINRLRNVFIVYGACLMVFFFSTAVALVSIVFLIKQASPQGKYRFILFEWKIGPGTCEVERRCCFPPDQSGTGGVEIVPLEWKPISPRIEDIQERSVPIQKPKFNHSNTGLSYNPRNGLGDPSRLRRRKVGSKEDSDINHAVEVERGDYDKVSYLLEQGCNVNALDSSGKSALYFAIERGNEALAQLLLGKGANPNLRDIGKLPVLFYAIEHGLDGTVRSLIRFGANVEAKDRSGNTTLHAAVMCNSHSIVQLLLEYEVNINKKNDVGQTPLYLAVRQGSSQIVQLLLENGANIQVTDNEKFDPLLQRAILCNQFEIIQLLLENGPKTKRKIKPHTMLHLAATIASRKTVLLLLKHGVEIDIRDDDGHTALHCPGVK